MWPRKWACIASSCPSGDLQYVAQSSRFSRPTLTRVCGSPGPGAPPAPGAPVPRCRAPAFKTGPPVSGHDGTMRFDTKIAVAVRADLETWQKLNVTAFLASGVAAGVVGVVGMPRETARAVAAARAARVLVPRGAARALAAARERAVSRGMP